MSKRKIIPIQKKMAESSVQNRVHFEKLEVGKMTNFIHVFWPIYCFARICGQMPFSIVHEPHVGIRNSTSRISKIDALWFFIAICIYSTLTFSVCVYLVRVFSYYGINPTLYVLASGVGLLCLTNFICGILILIMDMCNRHKIVSILKKITIFDREVRFGGK